MALPTSESRFVILTINSGSSSIRFALFQTSEPPIRLASGRIERIGLPESRMVVTDREDCTETRAVEARDHQSCVPLVTQWLERQGIAVIHAIGHRIVHGGTKYYDPEMVTSDLLNDLRRISPYDPEHLPSEIALIEAFSARDPDAIQIATFDTAFHHGLPRVASLVPIPRRYGDVGIRRYGFHGLSYAFLMRELARIGRPGECEGRIILAHLGNGASMAAVAQGKPVETTMGFTPASGLPMSRRSGDLDPGIVSYLARTEGMTIEQFHHMVNAESGLLGVSGISSDVRDLLAREGSDLRAAEAIELFCYRARKEIGALAATMGGLETLVFSGGIGENAPAIRARICRGLAFLGIMIDETRNEAGEAVISRRDDSVTVRVIRSDEESEIARAVSHVLQVRGIGNV